MTRPLRSTRITRLHHYYGPVRPCAPPRYSAPRSRLCLGSSLSRPGDHHGPVNGRQYRGDRFPRSAPEPGPGSRRLHAGHHPGSNTGNPRTHPRPITLTWFRCRLRLSTRHQRFALARLPGPHLTCSRHALSATLTTPALDRRSLRWFETSPCRAIPGGRPPSLAQHRSEVEGLLHPQLPFVRGTQRSRAGPVDKSHGRPHPAAGYLLEPPLRALGRPALSSGVRRVARKPAAHRLRCGSQMESLRRPPLRGEWLERGLSRSK